MPAIPLPEGGELTTLDDARTYILDLAEKAQQLTTWQRYYKGGLEPKA